MLTIIKLEEIKQFSNKLKERNIFEHRDIEIKVRKILSNVKARKDDALREYTKRFDGIHLEEFHVSKEELNKALEDTPKTLKEDLKKVKKNIEEYHKKQLRDSYFIKQEGITLGQIIRPIEKVGIYVPGGSASYPSTVLMNAIPAKIAGAGEIIMITPPNKEGKVNNSILAAALIAGVDKIFKLGGAHGIGALAFGTQSIPKVDKITGPGNIYVTMAKKQLSGYVGIDILAGPSEIMVIADKYANPKFIAADLISQAEHDELAASILVTDWEPLVKEVLSEIELQIKTLERKDIIKKSLKNYGMVILTNSTEQSVMVANEIAPEHLEILTKEPFKIYKKIKNAGAIFLGEYSPEAVGDYFAGTNHILPTSSTARFSSSLSVDDFIKKISLVYYSEEALKRARDSIVRVAAEEGLTAHGNSIRIRFEEIYG